MQIKLNDLEASHTWDVVDLPQGCKPIGCKWVYKVKYNLDGSINKYKARLVTKGYNQIEGIDYFDRFSPVAKIITVRMDGFSISINNAFLHGYLDEDIYMKLFEGYDKVVSPSVYDILLTGSSETHMDQVKDFLHEKFTIKDIRVEKYLLGLEIMRSEQGMFISQRKYITDIIKDLKMEDAKIVLTPLAAHCNSNDPYSPTLANPSPYRKLVGRLLYLNFTIFACSKIYEGDCSHGLFYSAQSDLTLEAYCDADLGSCPITRRSITDFCVLLDLSLISWKSKKQTTLADVFTKTLSSGLLTYLLVKMDFLPQAPS
ncbi:transmembrane signal receptor [Lithospermum erythrorhizon]|uniref:Transmembrane signal receptor n=1 Tax=Lithospermum erythrorhizon TaxID=34254 RepID=A0AAV3PRV0_LITER